MSHPSLGRPPRDLSVGSPTAARQIRASMDRLGARALEAAVERDPTLMTRYDELGLRERLHDAALLADRIALSVAAGDPGPAREYADWTAPAYRRKRVPLDDLINLLEGLRAALPSVVDGQAEVDANAAIDAAIAVYRWNRRLAGDARKRNAFLQLLYKGA
ncbi:MAG TPA: hypothetical protein VFN41_11615 [Candidatus Limnocylindrales bacterium]|nr:hypothetical protein [Candidatus Limnocylindrales bacterium]